MSKNPDYKEHYIYQSLEDFCKNGDAYIFESELFKICSRSEKGLTYSKFRQDLSWMMQEKHLVREGRRIYTDETLGYENEAASCLAQRMPQFALQNDAESPIGSNPYGLCDEQRAAVQMALDHPLSMILGGAGSGKSTLVRAIADHFTLFTSIYCAPIGKAARNLQTKTGLLVRTVHSALGKGPDEYFLEPVQWTSIDLVVVDEASMMTTGMLAGILQRVNSDCRVVLIGDSNQLQSVGAGNVIPDLLSLGVPHIVLQKNHRQAGAAPGLQHNVVAYNQLTTDKDLMYDDSFVLKELPATEAQDALVAKAAERYLSGASVQVLAPLNSAVQDLNRRIQALVNPPVANRPAVTWKRKTFRHGDRVIILDNDRDRMCANGDVGILLLRVTEKEVQFTVALPDGRRPTWYNKEDLVHLDLAYALTIHKSQGSEYDEILTLLTMDMMRMLRRNLFYTLISRARKQITIYGNHQAVDIAMQTPVRDRRSMIVTKTHQKAA